MIQIEAFALGFRRDDLNSLCNRESFCDQVSFRRQFHLPMSTAVFMWPRMAWDKNEAARFFDFLKFIHQPVLRFWR